MTVVVLDDEEKVCRLILQLVDWEKLGMTVAGTAHNGVDGLDLIQKVRPDLVITDIRMPGMDGLELIGRIRGLLDGVDFIIISGYHQFEYAHNAIRFGVEDYLLKPIKQTELNATLEKIAHRHRSRQAREETTRQLEARLESSLGKLRKDFFQDFLLAEETPEIPSFDDLNRTYGFRFTPGYYQMVVIKLDCPPRDFSGEMVRMLAEQAKTLLQPLLGKCCSDLELQTGDCRIRLLLNYPGEERTSVRKKLKQFHDDLQVRKSIFENAELTMALGSPVPSPEELRTSLLEAELMLGERLIGQTGRLYEEPPADPRSSGGEPLAAWNREMEKACELLDLPAARAAAENLGRRLRSLPDCTGILLLETHREAGHRFFILLANRGEEGLPDPEGMERQYLRELDLLSRAESLTGRLTGLVEEVFTLLSEVRRQAESRPIREARRYITEHFREGGISLEQVAEAVGFNPTYFSQLFKKETGSGFLEYLTAARMEAAKELLRTTKSTVAQVASDVGYSDVKHFTRLFRKAAGIKPSEFRKLYG